MKDKLACRCPDYSLPWIVALAFAFAAPLLANPAIEITSVPPYAANGFIDGTVSGVDFATHVVAVYIHIEGLGWWNKPTFVSPTVPIDGGGMFTADVDTGGLDNRATIFCAALIPDTVSPPIAAGAARVPAALSPLAIDCQERFGRALAFAGHTWAVKEAPLPVGPGSNRFSDLPSDVWVDALGYLHLTINSHNGLWWSTEIILLENLGHGTYTFRTASELDELDIHATFAGFVWDSYGDEDSVPGGPFREIDIEDSRWDNASDPDTSQDVVQPFYVPGNVARYPLPDLSFDPALTRFFTWQSDQVRFVALEGEHCPLDFPPHGLIHEFAYVHDPSSDHYVPSEGRERFRFNLWLNNVELGDMPPPTPAGGAPIEVIITDFTFTPIGATVPVALPGLDRTLHFGQSTRMGGTVPVSGGTPPFHFRWELTPAIGGQLDSDTAPDPVFTATHVGTYDASLTVTDSSRCRSAAAGLEIEVVCATDLELVDEVIDSDRQAISLATVTLERTTVKAGAALEIRTRSAVVLKNGSVIATEGELLVDLDPLADCP